MSSALVTIAGKLRRAIHLTENAILVVLLSGMIMLAALQIYQRNVIGGGFSWIDELLRILVLWLGMFGAMAAAREAKHINIDLISRILPGRIRCMAHALTALFTTAVCWVAAWYCYQFVEIEREFGSLVMGEFPAWTVQAIIPAAFGVIGLRYMAFFLSSMGMALGLGPDGEEC